MMLEFHPIANLFPMIEGEDRTLFVADIKSNGILEKIVMHEGKILDGRNRYRNGIVAGILAPDMSDWQASPYFVEFAEAYPDKNALQWVLSKNLRRRHLSESQRALVAHKLEGFSHGGARKVEEAEEQDANVHLDRKAAAEIMHVSPRSVAKAAKVATGAPELGAAVEAGRLSVSAGATLAELPKDVQKRAIESADPSVLASIIKEQRADKTTRKKQARADREERMGKAQLALDGQKFGVFYMDPEWRLLTYSENGMDRAADNHYPTSALEAIMRRDIKSIAAPDCVLFMWATVPMLMEAVCVLDAYGFASLLRNPTTGFLDINRAEGKYVSHAVWLKEAANGELANGMGYWLINEHEILIIARRGNPPAPAMGTQARSVLRTKRGGHSAKPDEAAEMIERYYPTMPKIELNRRGTPRPGWWAWGNEVAGDEALGIFVDANGFADASHLPLLTTQPKQGNDHENSGQHLGRTNSQQHDAAPISGADGRGESAHAGDQGQGAGTGSTDRVAEHAREIIGDNQAGGMRDVGSEGADRLTGSSGGETSAATPGPERINAPQPSVALTANAGGDDAQLSEHPGAPAAPGALSASYDQALEANVINPGQFTKQSAAPLLELGRKAGRTPKQLADDLGHPIGTIKTWLHRLELTDIDHMHTLNAERAAKAQEGAK